VQLLVGREVEFEARDGLLSEEPLLIAEVDFGVGDQIVDDGPEDERRRLLKEGVLQAFEKFGHAAVLAVDVDHGRARSGVARWRSH